MVGSPGESAPLGDPVHFLVISKWLRSSAFESDIHLYNIRLNGRRYEKHASSQRNMPDSLLALKDGSFAFTKDETAPYMII